MTQTLSTGRINKYQRMSVGVGADGNNKRHKEDNCYLNSYLGDSHDGCNVGTGVDEITIAVAVVHRWCKQMQFDE